METITLHFNEKIKEKLLEVLKVFSKNELQIVEENTEFEKAKKEVHKDYESYINGETTLMDIDEFEKELDDLLAKK